MNRLIYYFKLARIEHGLIVGFVPVATYLITYKTFNFLIVLILYLTTLLAEIFLFVTNDIFNIPEDRINRPNAPLVQGIISIKNAWIYSITSIIIAFILLTYSILQNLIQISALVVYIFAILLGFLYNIHLKKILIVNNFILSLVTSLSFIYGMFTHGFNLDIIVLLYFIMSFLATFGREICKGIIDIKGDLIANIKTIANTFGVEKAVKLVKYFTISAILVALIIIVYELLFFTIENVILILGISIVITLTVNTLRKLVKFGIDYVERFRKNILGIMSIAIITLFVYASSSFFF